MVVAPAATMMTMAVVVAGLPAVPLIAPAIAGVVAVAFASPAFKMAIGRLLTPHVACDAGACSTTQARTDYCTRAATYRLADCSTRGAAYGTTNYAAILIAPVGGYRSTSSATQRATNHRTALAAHALAQNRTSRCTCATAEQGSPVISACQGRHQQCTGKTSASNPTRTLNSATECG